MLSKIAVLTAPHKIELQKKEIMIQPDEVLVKVAVCGLCNWELGFFTGDLLDGPFGNPPMQLGHEWAGTVVEIGADVTEIKVGDWVTPLPDRLNGFAEYAVAKAHNCFKVAPHLDLKMAFSEPMRGIVTTIKAAAPEIGDYGVVIGCGPMGLWCVQGLAGKMLSALIAIDIDPVKLESAKKFGATHIINSKQEDVEKALSEITGGHMADFVIEGTGMPEMLGTAASLLRAGRGRLSVMSYYRKNVQDLKFNVFSDKGAKILNPHNSYSENPWDDTRRAVELINRGTFVQKDLVTHTFRLDEIQQAFEMLEHKPKGFIKGVVYPND